MEIVSKKIEELKPYEKNPRNNDEAVEYVANSIKEFGFKVPVVIDKNNVIVAGHTRYKACQKLGIKDIPCVIAIDLSPEQIKAFRLADNKVAEKSSWNISLLELELDDIINIDMEQFDFTIFEENEELSITENERHRTMDSYNLGSYDENRTEGFYDMPKIKACNVTPKDLIGFNYMLTSKDKECGIHFFIDDYQFERIWNNVDDYIEKLGEYQCVLTPDFSLYTEMPMAMKIWNTYRSRLIGQVMQNNGLRVVPAVSWCEKETFQFCFDGLPHNATLAISTIGVKESKESMKIWKDGVDEMIQRLTPKKILVYGGKIDYDFGNIKVVYYDNHVTENMKAKKENQNEI